MNASRRHAVVGGAAVALALALGNGSAVAQQKVEWILTSTETTKNHHTVVDLQKFADGVAKRTNGAFTIRVALEGELGFKRDAYVRALQRNQIQMASFDPGFLTAQVPHLGVFNLTFLQDGTLEQLVKIEEATRQQTYDAFKKLSAVPIGWFAFTSQELLSRDPIPNFLDLTGAKIRVWRELDAKLITRMKGVPVYLSGAEVYTALQRGVVTAANTGTPAMVDRSLQEVGKYLYRFGGPPASQYLVANEAALAALPAEFRNAVIEEGKLLTERAKKTVLAEDGKAVEVMKKAGVKEYPIPADQRDGLRKLARPLWDEWAAANPANKQALDSALKALNIK
jgi:TRAP-type C4-dicarboxylate transport system substrate-binding protein